MISVQEAFYIIRENSPMPSEGMLPLLDALGLRLAASITAPEPSPRFTNSAMDGYATRWEDLAQAADGKPVELTIAGESRAGIPYPDIVEAGYAVRISTGAMLPVGCDTVVRLEDTESGDGKVKVLIVRKKGQDVRYIGEEFSMGDPLLAKGIALQAPQLALLAGVGISQVPVFLPPRVALLVTGTELAATAEDVAPHQIRDSNSILLTAAVRQAGGEIAATLRTADSLELTVEGIRQAANGAAIVLVAGGVSVGPHDHVKNAATACGFTELFWRVRQKPGKPLFFARRNDVLLFGLPGNPVSAFMCFMLYVQPLIRSLQGREFSWRTVQVPLAGKASNEGIRTNFLRVALHRMPQGMEAAVLGKQGSHMLGSIAEADGFIIAEPGREYAQGEQETVYLFPWRKQYGTSNS